MPEKILLLGKDVLIAIAIVTLIMIGGLLGRALKSDQPFNFPKFIGESLLTCITSIGIVYAGLLQGIEPGYIVVVACLAGQGCTSYSQWLVALARNIFKNVLRIG